MALGAALASAALICLALPTTELGPLVLVALVPLLVLVRSRTRWRRFFWGWLVGFLVELVLFRWIPFTMGEMTPLPEAVGLLMWAAYALWHGLRFAVFALLVEPVRRAAAARSAALGPLAVATLYMIVEWLWPVIFPWALGHALWETPGAGALMALQGVPLVTFVVVLVNALVAASLTCDRAATLFTASAPLPALVLVALALAPGESERTLRVAILQPNYTLAEKKHADIAMRARLLARLDAQIRALPRDTYDLVVASEGAFPMWWDLGERGPVSPASAGDERAPPGRIDLRREATRIVRRAVAEGPGAHAIIGGLRRDEASRTRNSAVHIGPDGAILGHYDKQTLVPFSEYVPLAELFPALTKIRGIGNLARGERACAFSLPTRDGRGTQVACGICYESLFSADTRADAAGSELLVNLTIDTWFGQSTAPRMHLMTQASRAAELGVPLLRSALTGITAVVGPDGRVAAAIPADTPGVLDARVTLGDGSTLYRALGQWLCPLGLAALVALAARSLAAAIARRRERSSSP